MAQKYEQSYIVGKSHPYDFWNGGKKETNIMNLLSTLLFKAGLPTIPHNLPLQVTWTFPLPLLSTLNM